jgi:photosystem II stability/assembly factor-like uncharacterized protein
MGSNGKKGERLLVGTRKGLFVLERKGGSWRHLRHCHAGIPVSYAFQDTRDGRMWACLDHGHWGQKLERSDDLGETWEEVAAPVYPEDAVLKGGKPATLRYLWSMAQGGDDEPGRVYVGTEPGGLFVTDDGGEGFRLVESLWDHPTRLAGDGEGDEGFRGWFGGGRNHPGIHSILVDPRDSKRLWIGISCAGVFETTDGCETWSIRNDGMHAPFLPDPPPAVGFDPHQVVSCPADPETLWQQNHCGVFRSTDGGRRWHDVSQEGGPAFFGFGVCVDERDPETAWVVPAAGDTNRMAIDGAMCVCRTDDGGKTWTRFGEGLPQEHAYDLVLRHGFDLAGDRLAFGSTSGNVYASDDRGESWSPLGHHFPQVYSVRFG